jgi:hypothetical protein
VIGNDSCWTQIARDQVPLFDDDGKCCCFHAYLIAITRFKTKQTTIVACPLSRECRYERVVAAVGGAGWSIGDDGILLLFVCLFVCLFV